ncbi:MAG TPA: pirin family protein [Steroidobacteraceae bacterium]|nr:pirin family protein [Steroidobacteraceae bacterium]
MSSPVTTKLNPAASVRSVERVVRGQPASDGAGVKLLRIIGSRDLPDLDPFLLLDEFRSDDAGDYIAGFPEHPHRGFETVTYMLAGRMRHGDNEGNTGLLGAGSVQWMTAGRGIVHSEMPEQQDGLMWGFQLWVNLPAREKLTTPRYQDIAPERIPEVVLDSGGSVRVIAGEFNGTRGPVRADATQPVYLDVRLPAGAGFNALLPESHNAFVYVYEGELSIGQGEKPRIVKRGELAVLSQGLIAAAVAREAGVRFLVVAGHPLNEPVARYGPFVMNTPAEIRQALIDYQSGHL